MPASQPAIHNIKARYRIGDIVRGNCTSKPSRPAANLTWTINDIPVSIYAREENQTPFQALLCTKQPRKFMCGYNAERVGNFRKSFNANGFSISLISRSIPPALIIRENINNFVEIITI